MKKRFLLFFLLLAVLAGAAYVFVLSKPEVFNLEELTQLPRQKEVVLYVKNYDKVQKLTVKVLQEGREVELYSGVPKEKVVLQINPKKLGLKEGEATVSVELRRLLFLKETYAVPTYIDYTPPRVSILFSQYAVMNGGSGAVRISVSEEAKLSLKVKDREFPFYRDGRSTYFSLFAVPIDFTRGDSIKVVAVDKVGNRTEISLPVRLKRKKYPVYRIELKGREEKLLPKLSSLLGEEVKKENFIEAFRRVNEELRKENEEKLSALGRKTREERLWSGRFLQLKNSKVVSLFGEKRIYTYGGKKISESYHWGYDLASVKNAPVEAANRGIVVFAGFLGIYGNTVILDHGYGLMTVYSHLADFKVKEGQEVKKGQVIGLTDETGFAFGDHLHFGVMIHGYPVNPLEWWDRKWIRNNILPAISQGPPGGRSR